MQAKELYRETFREVEELKWLAGHPELDELGRSQQELEAQLYIAQRAFSEANILAQPFTFAPAHVCHGIAMEVGQMMWDRLDSDRELRGPASS